MSDSNRVVTTLFNGEASSLQMGEVVRVRVANKSARRAQANSAANLDGLCGVTATGASVTVPVVVIDNGEALVLMEAGLTINPGDRLYVSGSVAGRATNVAPANPAPIGVVKDASEYATTGRVLGLVTVLGLQAAGAAPLGGQLSGTTAAAVVNGITATGPVTALGFGTINTGQLLRRVGPNVVGESMPVTTMLWQANINAGAGSFSHIIYGEESGNTGGLPMPACRLRNFRASLSTQSATGVISVSFANFSGGPPTNIPVWAANPGDQTDSDPPGTLREDLATILAFAVTSRLQGSISGSSVAPQTIRVRGSFDVLPPA